MFHNFYRKSCRLLDNVEKYGITRQAADEKLYCEAEEMRFARRISKQITGK